MAVKIKLKRFGKKKDPSYRIVIADSRTARNGRAIEEIGIYQPMRDPSIMQVDSERAQYWLGVGAQPTEPVLAILKVTGDWQKYKGLPGAEGTLRLAEPKQNKQVVFEDAVREAEKAGSAPKAPKPKPEPVADKATEATEAVVEEQKVAEAAKPEETAQSAAETPGA